MLSVAIFPLDLRHQSISHGYCHGLQQSSLRIHLVIDNALSLTPSKFKLFNAALDEYLIEINQYAEAQLTDDLKSKPWIPFFQPQVWSAVQALNHLLTRLQETVGMPVANGIICDYLGPQKGNTKLLVTLSIPCLHPAAIKAVLPWVIGQLNSLFSGLPINFEDLANQLKMLQRYAPSGINNRQLLAAAYKLDVPVTPLPLRVYQYGWGSQSRWMDSTFSDAASTISAKLARSKIATHQLLARAGFPVPDQVTVRSPDQLRQAAIKMGYPVVVKPADLDGGTGVSAGLEGEAALLLAYERALLQSKNIILEKHIPGNDYRLGIVNGKLGWATLREPAGVCGNGQSTIDQLVAQTNQDPRRGTQKWSNMRPLVIDAPALELLAAQHVTEDTVVDAGRFIRLRRASNISAGGTPTNMMGRVHADNIALAEQVARLFRLDFAGIDLITPDITRSWKDVGGGICEVNGQPQFSVAGPLAPYLAIKGLLKGNGRIPVVVVLTDSPCDTLLANVVELQQKGMRLGFSHAGGLWVDGAYLKQNRESEFKDGQALLINPLVDAVIIATDGKEWLRAGMPFDRFDVLVIATGSDPKVIQSLRPQCSHAWECTQEDLQASEWASKISQTILELDALHRAVQLKLPDQDQNKP